jgi:hypothetical protein
MFSRILTGGLAAAAAGAAMLAMTAAPASAFTLAGPSLAPTVASGNIEQVWWDRWGRWHPNYYRWHRPYGYGYGWHRHCWRGPYGGLHCRAW